MTRPSVRLAVLGAAIVAAATVLVVHAWTGRRAERAARMHAIRLEAQAAIDEVARGFAAEIDALLAREAGRPYYVYQHYYSPPEALAAQFVIQTSPLVEAGDPLVDTYFEVLPNGRLTLPREEPGGARLPEHDVVAREILARVVTRVRRASGSAAGVAVAGGAGTATPPAVGAAEPPSDPQQGGARAPAQQRQRRSPQPRPRPEARPSTAGSAASADASPAVEPPAPQQGDGEPQKADGGPQQAGGPEQAAPQQMSPMPRWAVETNIRANDLVGQIAVANQGDFQTQQQLQADYNQLRGNPSNPPRAGAATAGGGPDAGAADAGDGPDAAWATGPGDSTAGEPIEPAAIDAGADEGRGRPRVAHGGDGGRRGTSPGRPARSDDAGADRPEAADDVKVAYAGPPPVAIAAGPQPPGAASVPDAAPAVGDEVPVIYGAFEPLTTPGGATYFVRTVDIESDVRVQGFRLSPGGIDAMLWHGVVSPAQRGHDAFRLVVDPPENDTALAAADLDRLPGAPRVAAILVPGSATFLAEDSEDRRIIAMLAGLSAVIALAVALAFLALRREIELARRKSDFMSAVSHELRAPVTTIRMYAEMLRDGWVEQAGRRAEYEAAIASEGERLSRLVENVLAYARRTKGKPLEPRDGDLAEKVREVAEIQRPVLERENLALEVESPAALPWRFDPDAAAQILVNLLDNAMKHSREASDRRVTVRLEASADFATIAVRDRGEGIPRSEQKRIFEPFYRVGPELTRRTKGAGLGLALVRRLAQAHGGDVSVDSEPGKGATFTVRLGRRGTG